MPITWPEPPTYRTYDAMGDGEDGPTHQPVEQLVSLRAIPGLTTLRPGDANEVVEAYRFVMQLPLPSLIDSGDSHIRFINFEDRISRNQRSRVAVRSKPQVNEIKHRAAKRRLPQWCSRTELGIGKKRLQRPSRRLTCDRK